MNSLRCNIYSALCKRNEEKKKTEKGTNTDTWLTRIISKCYAQRHALSITIRQQDSISLLIIRIINLKEDTAMKKMWSVFTLEILVQL